MSIKRNTTNTYTYIVLCIPLVLAAFLLLSISLESLTAVTSSNTLQINESLGVAPRLEKFNSLYIAIDRTNWKVHLIMGTVEDQELVEAWKFDKKIMASARPSEIYWQYLTHGPNWL